MSVLSIDLVEIRMISTFIERELFRSSAIPVDKEVN